MSINKKELLSKITLIEETVKQADDKKVKKVKDLRSVETLFRNSLRSNLDLTSLADSKASVLISVNGFILTVIITASGLYLSDPNMIYPFIMIMITALISILLGTMAIRPRYKAQLIDKKHLSEFCSVAYFQDMSETSPNEYMEQVKCILKDREEVHEHIIKHVHILAAEIKVKYYWLRRAYTAFALGIIISAVLMIAAMFKSLVFAPKNNQFINIYEPSGAISLEDGKVLLVEDESLESLQLIEIDSDGVAKELKAPKMSKEIKAIFEDEVRDLEGATSNGEGSIYLITSHSSNKADKRKVAREQIVRFKYHNGEVSDIKLYHGLLSSLEKVHPQFKYALSSKVKSRKKEISIEALAWSTPDNALLIGFRSPLIDKKAVVVELQNPNELFDTKQKPKLGKPILLDLDGDGIRGMSWDDKSNGYWIIAGDVGKRTNAFSLWFWNKEENSVSKSEKNFNIGYAEGITNIDNVGMLIVKDDGSITTHGANYIIIKDEK